MKKYIFDRNDFNWSEDFYKIIKDKFIQEIKIKKMC